MNPETRLLQRIQIRASEIGWRLFRNNVSLAWVGKAIRIKGTPHVILQNARRIKTGFCVGSSDLIGWRTIKITPEMVGQEIAVFSALEVKTALGRVTDEQENFIDTVRKAGGYARIARSADDL